MRTRLLLASTSVVVLGVLAGCGGDDDTASSPADLGDTDDIVEVLAEDISFPEDVYETVAGRVGFVYDNVGNIRHTLVIEGVDGFKLDVNSNGDVDQGAVDLDAGTYILFCDVPGHRAAGMIADLVVD